MNISPCFISEVHHLLTLALSAPYVQKHNFVNQTHFCRNHRVCQVCRVLKSGDVKKIKNHKMLWHFIVYWPKSFIFMLRCLWDHYSRYVFYQYIQKCVLPFSEKESLSKTKRGYFIIWRRFKSFKIRNGLLQWWKGIIFCQLYSYRAT